MAARPRARRASGVSCCVSRASVPGLRACGSLRSPVPSPVPPVRAGGGGGPGLPSPSPGPPSPCPPPALRFSPRRQDYIQSSIFFYHQPFVSIMKVVLSSTGCPPLVGSWRWCYHHRLSFSPVVGRSRSLRAFLAPLRNALSVPRPPVPLRGFCLPSTCQNLVIFF